MKTAAVTNASGFRIAVSHYESECGRAIVIAPGFFTSKDTKTFRRIAADLAKSFGVIAMDFRGHGKSEGRYTYSAREAEDLKAVIDYAAKNYRRIGVLGFSYGGSVAIHEAAEFKNIDSLVCVGSPMDPAEIEFRWWRFESMRLGILKFEWGNGVRSGSMFLPKKRAIEGLSEVEAPVMFVHGGIDPTVDARHSRMMHDAAKGRKKLKIFEKGSHAEDLYRKYPAEFISEVTRWFDETL